MPTSHPFAAALMALSAEAIPAPWSVYESDEGEWGLVHRRANGMVRPVADFPGSGEGGSSASDASVDLIELLRNAAPRIAALVEASAAVVSSWYGSPGSSPDPDAAHAALRAALTALDTEPT